MRGPSALAAASILGAVGLLGQGSCGQMLLVGVTLADAGAPDAAACPAGKAACGSVCASLGEDPGHCGACGHACTTGFACVNGACACARDADCAAPGNTGTGGAAGAGDGGAVRDGFLLPVADHRVQVQNARL